MSLTEVISNSFQQILQTNTTTITNTKSGKTFEGMVTSGDFVAAFTESDQDTEYSIQITTMRDNKPNTGDILLIEGNKYITQTVQSRTNSPLVRITAYLTKKKVK